MLRCSRRWLTAAGLLLPLVLAHADDDRKEEESRNGNSSEKLVRKIEYGKIEGVDNSRASKTFAWKGVPYAKAPVGELRWKAPVDPATWNGVLATREFANACAQYGRIYGPGTNNKYDETIGTTLNQAVGSEDCLYLNIWRPATGKPKLPVIVFFHGGSNVSGYTADPVYDGAALARTTDAVVVTVNFRLGIFGFLNLPQLKTGSDADTDSGNFAILDSIKSLQFVQRNIDSFGGDPNNVTIMGQSAGAINVYALLTSPKVANAHPKLFHRAVPLSGGLSLASNLPPGNIPTMSPASTYLAQGNALLYNLLIADGKATDTASAQAYAASQTQAQIAAYLRSKTPSALFTTLLTRLALAGLSGSGPIPEGVVVPADAIAAINSGNYARVPVLAGNTRDEGKLFPSFLPLVSGVPGSARIVSDAQLFAIQFAYRPNDPAQITVQDWIAPAYLPVNAATTGFTARADQFNRIFFLASRDNILNALKARQSDVWYYQFNWDKQPAPWNDIYGAAHLFDLPFVFGNFGPSLMANIMNTTANRDGRLELSEAMMRTLGAFAENGDPNNRSLGVYWPRWPARLLFDASLTNKLISVQ
jgi:para-nitrobenzyl esterase